MKRHIFIPLAIAVSLSASAQILSPDPDGYLLRARKMYADKNYIGATDQLQYFKQESPLSAQNEEADYLLALSAVHLKRLDAPSLLRYFLWKYPASPLRYEVILTLAQYNSDNHNPTAALTDLDSLDIDRLDRDQAAKYRYTRATSLIALGRYSEAAPLLSVLSGNATYGSSVRFYQGYIAYVDGDYSRAEDLLKRADTSSMPGAMAPYYLSQIAFANNDYSRAFALANSLISNKTLDSNAPYLAEALRIAGESQYNLGNDVGAVEILRRYLDLTSNPLPSARYIVGTDAYRTADYSEAITQLSPLANYPSAMGQSALLTIGQSQIAQGNYSAAMISLEKAFNEDYDPEIKETALYNYAVASTQGGKIPFGSTVNTFEQFLRQFPNSPQAPAIRQYIINGYITDGNYNAALASINATPSPSQDILKAKQYVLYILGSRETAAEQYPQATAHLKEALTLSSYSPAVAAETNLWLGNAMFAQKQYDQAAKAYRGALASKHLSVSNRPAALYRLGYALFDSEDYPAAEETFSQFVSLPTPPDQSLMADAYCRIADCQFVDSEFSAAADTYSRAAELNPATADYPLYQRAIAKEYQHDNAGKLADLSSLLSRFPESPLRPEAMLQSALTLEQMGQDARAIETYSTISTTYPETAQGRRARLLMALTYINNSNVSQAEQTYRDLITSAPTSEEASQAVDALRDILASQGRLDEFSSFMASVPTARQVDPSSLASAAFASAQSQYLNNGTTSRLSDFVERYENDANIPQALTYLMQASSTAGDSRAALAYASRLANEFPDNPASEEALLIVAQSHLRQGNGAAALDAFSRLRQKASTPQLTNEALMGIMQTSLELGQPSTALEAADAILASSTPSARQLSEAAFSRGLALSYDNKPDDAIAQWKSITAPLDDINATKAAFYIANTQFATGKTADARKSIEALIDSDTPHIYWLARGFILLSDIYAAEGNEFESQQYLISLRNNYPGNESDIINLIDSRLKK